MTNPDHGSLIGSGKMRTLLFCTSYCERMDVWNDRIKFWIKSVEQSGILYDQILIVDDASPVLPSWDDVPVWTQEEAPTVQSVMESSQVFIYTHTIRLGRNSLLDFPGWYRSFCFGARYGLEKDFDRIIHLESDAHLISNRIKTVVNNVEDAWTSFWCKKYSFPEIAIQIASGLGLKQLSSFIDQPYGNLRGRVHEYIIPFTHIDKTFMGDRYGEDIDHIPEEAEFTNQTSINQIDDFYWWMMAECQSIYEEITLILDKTPPFSPLIPSGEWASAEYDHQWMLGESSRIVLGEIEPQSDSLAKIKIVPCIFEGVRRQRLYIIFNQHLVGNYDVNEETELTVYIPEQAYRKDQTNTITFIHPDALTPSKLGRSTEHRNLAIAIKSLRFFKIKRCDEN